jgi:hypothetical protein
MLLESRDHSRAWLNEGSYFRSNIPTLEPYLLVLLTTFNSEKRTSGIGPSMAHRYYRAMVPLPGTGYFNSFLLARFPLKNLRRFVDFRLQRLTFCGRHSISNPSVIDLSSCAGLPAYLRCQVSMTDQHLLELFHWLIFAVVYKTTHKVKINFYAIRRRWSFHQQFGLFSTVTPSSGHLCAERHVELVRLVAN